MIDESAARGMFEIKIISPFGCDTQGPNRSRHISADLSEARGEQRGETATRAKPKFPNIHVSDERVD